jgi:hypothetical protein
LAEQAKDVTIIEDFRGIIDSTNADLIPAGAMVNQNNVICIKRNQLEIRSGYKKVVFDEE